MLIFLLMSCSWHSHKKGGLARLSIYFRVNMHSMFSSFIFQLESSSVEKLVSLGGSVSFSTYHESWQGMRRTFLLLILTLAFSEWSIQCSQSKEAEQGSFCRELRTCACPKLIFGWSRYSLGLDASAFTIVDNPRIHLRYSAYMVSLRSSCVTAASVTGRPARWLGDNHWSFFPHFPGIKNKGAPNRSPNLYHHDLPVLRENPRPHNVNLQILKIPGRPVFTLWHPALVDIELGRHSTLSVGTAAPNVVTALNIASLAARVPNPSPTALLPLPKACPWYPHTRATRVSPLLSSLVRASFWSFLIS